MKKVWESYKYAIMPSQPTKRYIVHESGATLDIAVSRGDGRYHRLLGQLQRTELLVLDDFLRAPATVEQCRDCSR